MRARVATSASTSTWDRHYAYPADVEDWEAVQILDAYPADVEEADQILDAPRMHVRRSWKSKMARHHKTCDINLTWNGEKPKLIR